MRQWIIGLCAAIALAACATPSEQAVPDPVQSAPPQPALFVAADSDSTLYLYGTIHLLQPDQPWGGPLAEAALAEADEVWTEVEISSENDVAIVGLMRDLGFNPPGRSLTASLAPEDRDRLIALCERLGIPIQGIDQMRPWLAAINLTLIPMMQAGFRPDIGVDRAIDSEAEAAGKTMRALETAEEQLRFLSGISEQAQNQMLRDAIEDAEIGPDMLVELSAAWSRGDLAIIEAMVVDEMRDYYPELFDAMFTRRNVAWADIFVEELEGEGTDFVAVGIGHLVGEGSVVDLLRAEGYVVERVQTAPAAPRR